MSSESEATEPEIDKENILKLPIVESIQKSQQTNLNCTQIPKSDSGECDIDFEIISTDQIKKMADQHQNGNDNHNGEENQNGNGTEHQNGEQDGGRDRTYSISEETEGADKLAQLSTKKSIPNNWNMMELGEKRKRLR